MRSATVLSPPSTTYLYNESLAVKATPDAGWVFDNWTGDTENLVDPNAESTNIINPIYDDTTIQANFSEQT